MLHPFPGLCSMLPWRFAGTTADKGHMRRRILKAVSLIGRLFNCERSHDLSRHQTKRKKTQSSSWPVRPDPNLPSSIWKFLQSQELLRTPNFAPLFALPCLVTELSHRAGGCNMSSRLHGLLRLRKEIFITCIENVVLLISQESIVSLLVL